MPKQTRLAVSLSHIGTLSRPGQADLLSLAAAADRAGVDQLVLSEHVVLASVITGHPGARPGAATPAFRLPPDEEYPEPLVALAAIAAATSAARLSTNILIAPLRPAVLLAKMAATVDVLSGGRLDLGLGSGWHREEFDALGVPFHKLAERMEDTVLACRALWQGGPASFSSPTVSFKQIVCSPTPVQKDGIPIWFGGIAALPTTRRIARMGDGWTVIGSTPIEDIVAGIALIDEECLRIDRDSSAINVRCSLPVVQGADGNGDIERTVAGSARFIEAGATIVQLPPIASFVRTLDEVEDVLRRARDVLRAESHR